MSSKQRRSLASPAETAVSQLPETRGRLRWALPAALAVLTFLAFAGALGNEFVGWDDDRNFISNLDFRGLSSHNLRWMFLGFHAGHYQPLAWLIHGAVYTACGMDPVGYHLAGIVFHALNAVLFYFLSLALIRIARGPERPLPETALMIGAWFGAALFALHPLRVEAVVWATELRDTLSATMLLGSALCYVARLRSGLRPAGARRASLWLAASWLLFVLALMSKVIAVVFPLILLILDVYPLRRLGPRQWFTREARRVWLEKALFAAAAPPFLYMLSLAQRSAAAIVDLREYALPARLAQIAYGLAFYTAKTFWPSNLSPLYQLNAALNPLEARYVASAAIVLVAAALLVALRRRCPGALAAACVYGVTLAPVIGVIQTGPQSVADRYSYLSCLGWAMLAGWAIAAILARSMASRRFARGLAAVAAATAAVVMLTVLTIGQTRVWRNSDTLWARVLQVEPGSPLAHYNVGVLLLHRERYNEAIQHFRIALAVQPSYSEAANNLGIALYSIGRQAEGISYFHQALKLDPNNEMARRNLADLHEPIP